MSRDVQRATGERPTLPDGDTRAGFLRRAAVVGGGVATLGLGRAGEARAAGGDTAILEFALTLELLVAAFYTEALANRVLSGDVETFARAAQAHETAHVRALRSMLGTAAVETPTFNFKGTTEDAHRFQATATALEDASAAAYRGQAPLIESGTVLAAALAIHAVEARHASWIRHLAAEPPAPAALDEPRSGREVLGILEHSGFIWTTAKMRTSASPEFTG